jgi:glutamine amidotransferase
LPGVGHYTEGARRLSEGGWRAPIAEFAASGKPLLGICLGMQLLGEGSAEGDGEGLGLLPFRLERLPAAPGTPVPHMGWNTVAAAGAGSPLLESEEEARFYFVHSYAVRADSALAQGTTDYGTPFASVVGRGNVHGVQFHPEKSHRFGMTLLRNFAREA